LAILLTIAPELTVMLQWSKEEDEVLAQVTSNLLRVATKFTLFHRPSQSMVRNGTRYKKLCHNEGITKSDNDG
jgi:hypothetical protein